MIPNRLIRREMQKKKFLWRRKSALNGGGGGPAAFFLWKIPKLRAIIDSIKKILPNYL